MKYQNINLDNNDFILSILKVFTDFGITDPLTYRNYRIKVEFAEMRSNKTTSKIALNRLASNYNLSIKQIESIVYKK